MKSCLRYPNKNCLGMISKKMNEFIANEYSLDNYCDIGQIINRKLLPYIPILTHLMSDDKLNGENIKLIQLLFLVSIIRGIPNIMNIYNNNTKAINFDIALVFNKEVLKSIKKSISHKDDSIVKVTSRKRIKQNAYFKQNNYFNIDNIYQHIFKDVIKGLKKLNKDQKSDCDLIRVYIDMTQGIYYLDFCYL